MLRPSLPYTLVLATCAAMSGIGCQKEPASTVAPENTSSSQKLSPEESFELVVDTFRRGVEDIPIGFIVQDSGRQTMMTGRNEVSDELIPPPKDGEPYKAIITVRSQSRYSLQRSKQGSTENEPADESVNEPAADDSGVQIFDPSIASAPEGETSKRNTTATKADKNAVTVARNDDEHERKYELIYKDGRWRLVTKLDPKTEGSIQLAFDRALDSQI